MKEYERSSLNTNRTHLLKTNKSLDLRLFLSKIKKNTMFNAFDRKNLGSIPSKFDNYLFNLEKEKTPSNNYLKFGKKFKSENLLLINDIFKEDHSSWKNFGSGNDIEFKGNTLKISVNNDLNYLGKKSEYDSKNIDYFKSLHSFSNDNHSFRNKNEILLNKGQNESYMSKKTYNNKDVQKMKFPNEDRYFNIFYKNERIERYMPGPADYSPQKEIENKNNLRYDSLFKKKEFFPLIEIKATTADVGPGSYDLIKDRNIPGGVFSKLKKYDNFNNPFMINDKNIKTNFGDNDPPGSINIKDIYKKNYFFMIHSPRKEKLEKKFGLIRNDNEINKTISKRVNNNINNRSKGKSINIDWINTILQKKIKEKLKEGTLLVDDINNEIYNEKENENERNKNGDKEKIKNRGKMFSFNKIPRFFKSYNNHVPGPSYYDPEKIMAGIKLIKNFNLKENSWI